MKYLENFLILIGWKKIIVKFNLNLSIQSIPTTSLIPTDFMDLLESEVFTLSSEANSMNFSSAREKLWEHFACWAYFFIGSNFRKQFRNHCRRLWSKINIHINI